MNYFAVHFRLTQHCKLTTPQFLKMHAKYINEYIILIILKKCPHSHKTTPNPLNLQKLLHQLLMLKIGSDQEIWLTPISNPDLSPEINPILTVSASLSNYMFNRHLNTIMPMLANLFLPQKPWSPFDGSPPYLYPIYQENPKSNHFYHLHN